MDTCTKYNRAIRRHFHGCTIHTEPCSLAQTLPRKCVSLKDHFRSRTSCMAYRTRWTLVVLMVLCLGCSKAFNVDTTAARILEGPADSYFGFALSLHSNSHGDWLLVGAPKASDFYQRSVNTSGALYQCSLEHSTPCSQVKLDVRGNYYEAGRIIARGQYRVRLRYSDHKDDQWLGVSLDSHQTGRGAVVVCAHRWGDKRYIQSGFLMMNGACYVTDGDLTFNATSRLLPLTRTGRQVHAKTHEFLYAYGQAGLTAHYTKHGEKLLLGAPGIRDWTGGVVEFAANNEYVAVPDRNIPKNSYIGYTLTSGQFYGTDQTHYVTGGPRINMKGRVVVYSGHFDIKLELAGRQFGEYFGGALCVSDVNQDGLDDLLVGAPLYTSRRYEEGRVAVYITRHTHVFDHVTDLVGSEVAGSRFGSAITSADITLDGYPDILVGAPYEDSGRGVVYVYNGYRHGLHTTPSQRLSALLINPQLRGFGYSLTKPRVRRNQQYPDIAVGSPMSNMAVVLPSRPLVVVQMNASTYPSLINPGVVRCHLNNFTYSPRSCLAIGVVFKYSGLGIPPTNSFTVTVRVNADRQEGHPVRGGFKNGTVNNTGVTYHALSEVSTIVSDWPAQDAWKDHFIFMLNKHVVDVLTPVSISVEVDFLKSSDNSTNLGPMLDKYSQRSMTLNVPFDKFCGEDNHCKTDLQLHAFVQWTSPDREYIILGQEEPISIEVHINNVGEKAYMTNLTILHPPELEYAGTRQIANSGSGSQHPVTCTPHASQEDTDAHNCSAMVVCEVGNPIPDTTMKSVVIIFRRPLEYHQDSFLRENMVIQLSTRTRSQEKYLGDNDITLSLPVKVSAEMDITGVSYPEQHLYEVQPDNTTTNDDNETTRLVPTISQPEVYHIYDLRNEGPGLFPGGQIEVHIPVESVMGHRLLDFSVEILDATTQQQQTMSVGNNNHRERRDVPDEKSKSGLDHEPRSADPPTSVTPVPLFGKSRMQPYDLFCGTAHCEIKTYDLGPLNVGESTTISIYMTLHMNNLTLLQDNGAVRAITRVLVHGLTPATMVALTELQVTTLVTPRHAVLPSDGVPWWVVAASVGVGLVLLLVVISVLYKFGFFTRAEREELVKLINQNEENEAQESRMMHASETTPDGDLDSYDPWQPQAPETSLLIWHANGSISHNSREEYLAATRRSSSSTHDRNLNEKPKPCRHLHPEHTILNGGIHCNGSSPSHLSLPSTSGSTGSTDRRGVRSSRSSPDDDVFYDTGHHHFHHPRSFDIPNYLVIRPAEDTDEEQLFTDQSEPIHNGYLGR